MRLYKLEGSLTLGAMALCSDCALDAVGCGGQIEWIYTLPGQTHVNVLLA